MQDRLTGFIAVLLHDDVPYGRVERALEILNEDDLDTLRENKTLWFLASAFASEIIGK